MVDAYRDQTYLLNDQYKDAAKFSARVDLHRRFSVNPYGFHHWVFDHLPQGPGSKLLELGCGPGGLWLSNQDRIPTTWQITLTDFSPGMLQEAQTRLGEQHFTYEIADAQALPFADASFDAVIANHMLYHIPDLKQALLEIRRVLRPAAYFYASTFGREDMRELDDLLRKCWPNLPRKGLREKAQFVLENGEEVLTPFFREVTLYTYADALEVSEALPLSAYVLSGKLGSLVSSEKRQALTDVIRLELAKRGTIHLTKALGLFVARTA